MKTFTCLKMVEVPVIIGLVDFHRYIQIYTCMYMYLYNKMCLSIQITYMYISVALFIVNIKE